MTRRWATWSATPWTERARQVLLVVGLLGSAAFFLRFVDGFYPVRNWLFWVYLRVWLAAIVFGLACLSAGNAVLKRVVGRTLPLLEHFAFAFGIGLFAFYVTVFVAGLLGLLKPWFFFAAPMLLILSGASTTLQLWRRVWRHWRTLGRSGAKRRFSIFHASILMAGAVAIAALYFPILTPDNVAYDARWYHLPLAEHYAAVGAVRRSPEGWLPAAYPHLVSYLYTWAMLVPGVRYFEHVELCAHLEFVVFLATLPAIAALTRQLVPRARFHGAWVAMFLFPEIFAYDSTLAAGADHVAALWAPLILLAFLRAVRQNSAVFAGLMALAMAGALCTKFTAASVVLFPMLGLVAWTGYRAAFPAAGATLTTYARILGSAALVGVLATSPHWLKNVVWYGDPLYPTLQKLLSVRPWTPDFSVPFEHWFYPPDYHPSRDAKGIMQTFKALLTYSFVPNDWWVFHRDVPIFGSLSTLSLVVLPFLRGTKRIWLTQVAIHVGLFLWYSVHHFDRYLQTILPWMAASLAATFYLLWQQGTLVRLSLGVLVAAQAVWGADVYFFPTHAMADGSAIKKSLDLLATGHQKNYRDRYKTPFEPYIGLVKDLPPQAKILVHENHVHWALERATVSDWQGTQAGISYGRLSGIRETDARLRSLGVTHVYWDDQSSKGYDTLAADLNFFAFAKFALPRARSVGRQKFAPMPASPPQVDFQNTSVLFVGCAETYANGTYELNDLVASDIDPRKRYPKPRQPLKREIPPDVLSAALAGAALSVVDPACYPNIDRTVAHAGFTQIARRNRLELFAREPVASTGLK